MQFVQLCTQEGIVEGFNVVTKRINQGYEVCRFIADFWKQYSHIEDIYAKSLAKLLQSSEANFNKVPAVLSFLVGNSAIQEIGPLNTAWQSTKQQIGIIAQQHAAISSQMHTMVASPIIQFLQNDTAQSKFIIEGRNLLNELKKVEAKCEQDKQRLDKLKRDEDALNKKIQKAQLQGASYGIMVKLQQQLSSLQADIQTQQNASKQSQTELEVFQQQLLKERMPPVFSELQVSDGQRVDAIKDSLDQFAGVLHTLVPILKSASELIHEYVQLVDKASMADEFVQRSKPAVSPLLPQASLPDLPNVDHHDDDSDDSEDSDSDSDAFDHSPPPPTFQPPQPLPKPPQSQPPQPLPSPQPPQAIPKQSIPQLAPQPAPTPQPAPQPIPQPTPIQPQPTPQPSPPQPLPSSTQPQAAKIQQPKQPTPQPTPQPQKPQPTPQAPSQALPSPTVPSSNPQSTPSTNPISLLPPASAPQPFLKSAPEDIFAEITSITNQPKKAVAATTISLTIPTKSQDYVDPTAAAAATRLSSILNAESPNPPPSTRQPSRTQAMAAHFEASPTQPRHSATPQPRPKSATVSKGSTPPISRQLPQPPKPKPQPPPTTQPIPPPQPVPLPQPTPPPPAQVMLPPPAPVGVSAEEEKQLLSRLLILSDENDYLKIFEIDLATTPLAQVTLDVINKKRRDLNRKLHPDHFANDVEAQQKASSLLAKANDAYLNVFKEDQNFAVYRKLCEYRREYVRLLDRSPGDQMLRVAANNLYAMRIVMKRLNMPTALLAEIAHALDLLRLCRAIEVQQ